jgi:hypothetical protein
MSKPMTMWNDVILIFDQSVSLFEVLVCRASPKKKWLAQNVACCIECYQANDDSTLCWHFDLNMTCRKW